MKITAVVCTYNRKSFLYRCLDSLVNQTYDDYELVVVDDCSTDGTSDAIEIYAQQISNSSKLRYIKHNTNKGLAASRNTAIKNAQGEIIAFTDNDCLASPDWLTNIAIAYHNHPEASAVGGLVLNGYEDSITAEIGQQIVTYHLYDKLIDGSYTSFLVGNNHSYKTKVLEDVGFFDERIKFGGDDHEIQSRILSHGYKMLFCPDITVTHFQRNTTRSFVKQYYTYGLYSELPISHNYLGTTVRKKGSFLTLENILGLIVKPYKVAKHMKKRHQQILCYPLVYAASVVRGAGILRARLRGV